MYDVSAYYMKRACNKKCTLNQPLTSMMSHFITEPVTTSFKTCCWMSIPGVGDILGLFRRSKDYRTGQ